MEWLALFLFDKICKFSENFYCISVLINFVQSMLMVIMMLYSNLYFYSIFTLYFQYFQLKWFLLKRRLLLLISAQYEQKGTNNHWRMKIYGGFAREFSTFSLREISVNSAHTHTYTWNFESRKFLWIFIVFFGN